jgi:transcription initiation factor TFIID TATA-box-binding protein
LTDVKEEPEIKIENVVASATLEHGIDLQAVAKAFPIVEYKPDVFPGLVLRTKRPRTANLIFRTGKMVCTGAKSERDTKRALKKVIRKLKNIGMVIHSKLHIKTQNIVASVILGGKVDLEGFYEVGGKIGLGGGMMYEPEQFPGLIYRMENPKVVILIFSSGKLVCTGATKEEEVHQAVMKLCQELDENDAIIYDTS